MHEEYTKNNLGIRDNLFVDTYAEVVEFYSQDNALEAWEDRGIISIRCSNAVTGLCDKSDIIIVYDMESGEPQVITERIYRKNYPWGVYRSMVKKFMTQVRQHPYTGNFLMKVTKERNFCDIIHYKERWYQCAMQKQQFA